MDELLKEYPAVLSISDVAEIVSQSVNDPRLKSRACNHKLH